jgi:hypothetical protein
LSRFLLPVTFVPHSGVKTRGGLSCRPCKIFKFYHLLKNYPSYSPLALTSFLFSYSRPNMFFSYYFFFLDHVYFFKNNFWKIIFQTFLCLFTFRKVSQQKTLFGQRKTFLSQKNLTWFSGKCFSSILDEKYFLKVVKNLEMSYYLLIISNLILKLLIAIYILFWIFVF